MKGLRILLRPPNRNNFPHLPPNQKFRPIRGMPASGFRGPWMLWIVDFTEWDVPAAFVVYGAGKYGALWVKSFSRCFAAAELLFLGTCLLMQTVGVLSGARRCQGHGSVDYFADILGIQAAKKEEANPSSSGGGGGGADTNKDNDIKNTEDNDDDKAEKREAQRRQFEQHRRTLLREVRQSSTCMLVVACMASFPVMAHTEGLYPTGLTWSAADLPRGVTDVDGAFGVTNGDGAFGGAFGGDCSSSTTATKRLLGAVLDAALAFLGHPLVRYAGSFVVGIAAADAWTYAKHRALHSKWLYAFHRSHHYFKDPTAFAGFAIHPVEAVWTFAPIFLWEHLPHFLPVFAPAVAFFFALNAYLHCGYVFGLAEALLPRVLLNSSAFHNLHHERVVTHFGEISSFWDYACGTSDIYAKGLGTGYRWHVARSAGMQGPGLTA